MRLATLAALLVLVLPLTPAAAQPAEDGTIQIIKEDEAPSAAELVARLSEATDLGDADTVLIGRDDDFADALASGVLQGAAPLLLVPRDGDVPARISQEIDRLAPAEAIILGGEAAVSEGVEAQLRDQGLTTQRRAGATRIETAVQIAATDAPEATTAILTRAFGDADGGDPTQGFADSLAVGALAAERGWPVLLTASDELSAATRDHLAASGVERVLVVGGTAAIGESVAQEVAGLVGQVERIAGPTRFDTAVEVAKALGYDTAADADRVVLVDGTSADGFVGGFAAAAHAAATDAPILLVDAVRVPPATAAYLGTAAGDTPVTCVVHPLACEEGREALGLIDFLLLDADPAPTQPLAAGQAISLSLRPEDEAAGTQVAVSGDCLDEPVTTTADAQGRLEVVASSALPTVGLCQMSVQYVADLGVNTVGWSYDLDPDSGYNPDFFALSADVFTYGSTVSTTPVALSESISCTDGAITDGGASSTYEARYVHPESGLPGRVSLSSAYFPVPGRVTCTDTIEVPDGIGRVLWGVYSWSDSGLREPLLLGEGTEATFALADLDVEPTDLEVVWVVEVLEPEVGVATPPVGTPRGAGGMFNPDGVDVTCDGTPVPAGFSTQAVGASCTMTAPAGELAYVVQPGRPVEVVAQATFTIPDWEYFTGVHVAVRDGQVG